MGKVTGLPIVKTTTVLNTISRQNLQTTQGVRLFRLHEKMQIRPGDGLLKHIISNARNQRRSQLQ